LDCLKLTLVYFIPPPGQSNGSGGVLFFLLDAGCFTWALRGPPQTNQHVSQNICTIEAFLHRRGDKDVFPLRPNVLARWSRRVQAQDGPFSHVFGVPETSYQKKKTRHNAGAWPSDFGRFVLPPAVVVDRCQWNSCLVCLLQLEDDLHFNDNRLHFARKQVLEPPLHSSASISSCKEALGFLDSCIIFALLFLHG
jgi:hypothetical protein